MTHPKVARFLDKLRPVLRPKSTINIFCRWADIARAYGVSARTIFRWKTFAGWKLPVTRVRVDQFLRDLNLLHCRRDNATLVRLLEHRICKRTQMVDYCKMFKLSSRKVAAQWKEILKRYDTVRCLSNEDLPETVEEVKAIYKEIIADRRRTARLKRRDLNP